MFAVIIASVCLIWYITVVIVCTVGYVQLYRYYGSVPPRAVSESLPYEQIPHVTIIRPVKGIEPNLYECLAATFRQTYPRTKLTIFICVSSREDPSFPILCRIVEDFPGFDVKVLVEDEDDAIQSGTLMALGPNPKIRNMSRAYREAKGDIVWIIDCNVWVGKGVAGRMVDKLCGYSRQGSAKKYKFVHQLPLVVDVTGSTLSGNHHEPLLSDDPHDEEVLAASTSTSAYSTLRPKSISNDASITSRLLKLGGGRLEELFLASSHAKFYTAINTVLIAPCIVGKSNMFRRSHLDALTQPSVGNPTRPSGLDYFSHNICEDHLIGDLLWKQPVPEEQTGQTEPLGKHAMVFGDLAIQPMAGMSVTEYFARRVRWLRVRKFTVPMATWVEPGTESFLCSAYGAFAVTTIPWFFENLGIPRTWSAGAVFWVLSVTVWAIVDWTLFWILHSMDSVEMDENTPAFVRNANGKNRRSLARWLLAWLGREVLALPIWSWAIYGGVTVVWRGKRFKVGIDATVRELDTPVTSSTRASHGPENGVAKARQE